MNQPEKLHSYGYEEGLLSNSMLQAAITCPLKYQKLYIEGVNPEKNGVYFNAAFVGNVVHHAIEHHDHDLDGLIGSVKEQFQHYFGEAIVHRTASLSAFIDDAKTATQKEGEKWGRVYKAPEMTSYWKKNYAGLDNLLERLDMDAAMVIPGAVFDMPYSQLYNRAITAVKNWTGLRLGDALCTEVELRGIVGQGDWAREMVGSIDRVEKRGTGYALCDYKSGRWGYDLEKVMNSDQLGLYDILLEANGYGPVLEWVLYDLTTNECVRVVPDERIRSAARARLETNLRYMHQIEAVMRAGIEVPVPAGSAYKTGCPCILAKTGDCHYYVTPESSSES